MTYPSLLAAIYADFDTLWAAWSAEMEKTGDPGLFIFLPAGYREASALARVSCAYWDVERTRSYLEQGGESSDGLDALVDDLSVAEEFLVMIVEEDSDPRRRSVHIHRITKLERN